MYPSGPLTLIVLSFPPWPSHSILVVHLWIFCGQFSIPYHNMITAICSQLIWVSCMLPLLLCNNKHVNWRTVLHLWLLYLSIKPITWPLGRHFLNSDIIVNQIVISPCSSQTYSIHGFVVSKPLQTQQATKKWSSREEIES